MEELPFEEPEEQPRPIRAVTVDEDPEKFACDAGTVIRENKQDE